MDHHAHSYTGTGMGTDRLSRAIGHLESIKEIVEEGRDCTEALIQITAVKPAVSNVGELILQDHIQHCVVAATVSGGHPVSPRSVRRDTSICEVRIIS